MDDPEVRALTRDRAGARLMWLSGLAALAGFLIASPLLSLIATLVTWSSQRDKGRLSVAAGIEAINWQLTYLAFQLMLVPLHLALVTVQRATGQLWPLFTISALLLLGTLNVVLSVVLGIRAGQGRSTHTVLAIPFVHESPPKR